MGKGGRSEITYSNSSSLSNGGVTKSDISTKATKVTEKSWKSTYNPLDPNAPPLPTKGQIKAAIPSECFERSALHSFWYVYRDSVMAGALVYFTSKLLSTELPDEWISVDAVLWVVGWNFYAFWMGCILTGHWVLGHECGHGAFSSSQFLNDIVGFTIHQALLVPYFAWQYTHAKHHRRTNHIMDGESHVPSTGEDNGLGPNNERQSFYAVWHEAMGDGAFAAFQVFTHLVIGWPLYLMGMASTGKLAADGSPVREGEFLDHFRPNSRMFPRKHRFKILLSTLTIFFSLGYLCKLCFEHGFITVGLWYFAPYMWTNSWLVLYTWLQHTDPSVPHYGSEEWTWVKGALSTIDRPYGIFDFFHHKIGSTHVVHHLFHEMPFYKADIATAAVKDFLGPLYNYDPTPFYIAMWRIAKTCHYIDDTEGIQYYKSLQDVPKTKEIAMKRKGD